MNESRKIPIDAEDSSHHVDTNKNTIAPLNVTANANGYDDSSNGKEKKISISDLPDDVFRNIHDFFSIDVLLLLPNRRFHAMKGRLYYYTFSCKYSRKYNVSETFRGQVEARISDISFQVSLNLSKHSDITDVSVLKGVHKLNLSHCDNITDVSMLGGVHDLNLSHCSNITDVSMLGNIHTLNVSHCDNITDVSMLGGLYSESFAWQEYHGYEYVGRCSCSEYFWLQ